MEDNAKSWRGLLGSHVSENVGDVSLAVVYGSAAFGGEGNDVDLDVAYRDGADYVALGKELKRAFADAGIILDLAVFTESYLIGLLETGKGGFALVQTMRNGERVHAEPGFGKRVDKALARVEPEKLFAETGAFRLSCLRDDVLGAVRNMDVLAAECCWALYSRNVGQEGMPGYPQILDACLERGIIDGNMFDRIKRICEMKKESQAEGFNGYKAMMHELAELHPWVRLFVMLVAAGYEPAKIQAMLANR